MLHNARIRKLIVYLFLTMFFFISTQNILAQGNRNVLVKVSDNAIDNLNSAIKSENPGLRKSGIYLAGKYSINEVSETLVEQLKVDNDPNLRILIIRVLYIIENDKYADDISNIALSDRNPRVRNMASSIYSAMQLNNQQNLVDNIRTIREFR